METDPKPRFFDVARRGLRRRCPRCGEGPLFRRWIEAHDRCSKCGLQYQRNYGDTWGFIVLTDRIPIMFGVIAVYFGIRSTTWVTTAIFTLSMAIPLLATMRERLGLAIALDYLSRVYLPDPSDEIHAGPSSADALRRRRDEERITPRPA